MRIFYERPDKPLEREAHRALLAQRVRLVVTCLTRLSPDRRVTEDASFETLQDAYGETVGGDQTQATKAGTGQQSWISASMKSELVDPGARERPTITQPTKATQYRPMRHAPRLSAGGSVSNQRDEEYND